MSAPPKQPERRRDLMRRRLFDLEKEAARVYQELTSLGSEEALPGAYVVMEAAGYAAVLPAPAVCEIVRLVEFTRIPHSPPHVLGTFLYRGTVVTTLDLPGMLGRVGEPALDSHLIVLSSSRPLGLVVDRVRALIDSPLAAAGGVEGPGEAWRGSGLAVGLCTVMGEVLPILGVAQLVERLGTKST